MCRSWVGACCVDSEDGGNWEGVGGKGVELGHGIEVNHSSCKDVNVWEGYGRMRKPT